MLHQLLEIIEHQIRWMGDHVWWIRKHVRGNSYVLFQGHCPEIYLLVLKKTVETVWIVCLSQDWNTNLCQSCSVWQTCTFLACFSKLQQFCLVLILLGLWATRKGIFML